MFELGRLWQRMPNVVATMLAMAVGAAHLSAQTTTLTLSGGVITFPAPTATDYINGYVNSTAGVTYTLNATKGNQSHTTTVFIRATSANLGNGKVLGDLQWRRSDLSAWNSIASTDVQVEQKVMIRNSLNDPWSNTIFFRLVLSWTTDAPATYTANYQITLSQTVP